MKLCASHLSTRHQLQKYRKLNNIYSEDDFRDKTVIIAIHSTMLDLLNDISTNSQDISLLSYIIFDQVLYSKLLATSFLIMLA